MAATKANEGPAKLAAYPLRLAHDLVLRYHKKFLETKERSDIDFAISNAEFAVKIVNRSSPDFIRYVNNVGFLLGERYRWSGQETDVEEAIEAARQAALASPNDHDGCLRHLSSALWWRYKKTRHQSDLDEGISVLKRAIQVAPDEYPNLARYQCRYALLLQTRHELNSKIEDISEAVRVTRQALSVTGHDDEQYAHRLNQLANQLGLKYMHTKDLELLRESIDLAQRAVDVPSNNGDVEDRAISLHGLGIKIGLRYDRTRHDVDLEAATSAAERSVELTPKNSMYLAGRLTSLANRLELQYRRTSDVSILTRASAMAREAVEVTPNGDEKLTMHLNNFANTLETLYERNGQKKDIDEAVRIAQQAVNTVSNGSILRASILNSLACKLNLRHMETGEKVDLDQAIVAARKAVRITPDDHVKRENYNNNLSAQLNRRYGLTGEVKDLKDAIELIRQALNAAADDRADRVGWLNNLGLMLRSQFHGTKDVQHLQEAIRLLEQVVRTVPVQDTTWPGYASNLGEMLADRYRRLRDVNDINNAIEMTRSAIKATPAYHASLPTLLTLLGNELADRYHRTGEIADLEESIRVSTQAIEETPEGHAGRASSFIDLAKKLFTRILRKKQQVDLESAISYTLDAYNMPNGPALVRLEAASFGLLVLAEQRRIEDGIKLGRDALDLLPQVNARFLTQSDRQFVLRQFGTIASELCAFLLPASLVDEALQQLERGRAVIIGQLLDDRGDPSTAIHGQSELAERYRALLMGANSHLHERRNGMTDSTQDEQRRQAAIHKLESCVKEIRSTEGSQRFMLGQTIAEIQNSVRDGFVVVVNMSPVRTDAIIVSKSTLKASRLPNMSSSDAEAWLGRTWSTNNHSAQKALNEEFERYPLWLWQTCVKFILHGISSLMPPGQGLPRIWWIGTGLASSMPFHAAGIHMKNSTDNAFSQCISSYTPSIKALAHVQAKAERSAAKKARDLKKTPRRLKDVMKESDNISEIARTLSPATKVISLPQPSVEDLRPHLEVSDIAHFACHGISNGIDPSNSGLILQKQGPDGLLEQDFLSVYDISEMQLPNAHIAYLSACSTAENKVKALQHEVIHVVSGFQAAGFPHVIDCLWPAGDRQCVQVATRFYSSILRNTASADGAYGDVALALREAVSEIRDEWIDMPLKWAQFVHYGA